MSFYLLICLLFFIEFKMNDNILIKFGVGYLFMVCFVYVVKLIVNWMSMFLFGYGYWSSCMYVELFIICFLCWVLSLVKSVGVDI